MVEEVIEERRAECSELGEPLQALCLRIPLCVPLSSQVKVLLSSGHRELTVQWGFSASAIPQVPSAGNIPYTKVPCFGVVCPELHQLKSRQIKWFKSISYPRSSAPESLCSAIPPYDWTWLWNMFHEKSQHLVFDHLIRKTSDIFLNLNPILLSRCSDVFYKSRMRCGSIKEFCDGINITYFHSIAQEHICSAN